MSEWPAYLLSKCCSDNTPDGLGPLAQTLKNKGQQTARLAWAKWPRPLKVLLPSSVAWSFRQCQVAKTARLA